MTSSSSFILRSVFGLIVLCVFHSSFISGQLFKNVLKTSSSSNVIPYRVQQIPPPIIPLTSAPSNVLRSNPFHSSQTSLSSMSDVSLRLSSAASTMLSRSYSSPSLNRGAASKTAVIISHAEAASTLNKLGVQPLQLDIAASTSAVQRLIPNMDNVRAVGRYLKTGALTAAGTGGVIQIVNSMKEDECCERKIDQKEVENIENEKRVEIRELLNVLKTQSRELSNPLGRDK